MRLRRLSLIRYGKFTDRILDLPPAEQDMHLILGPNEAGKSTTRTAIGDLLFGIPMRTPLAFLHPMPELRLGALVEQGGRQLAFERSKGSKQTLRGSDDAPLSEDALRPWLGDTSRALFEQMHGLDHAALVEGGDGILSAAGDLGRLLFQSAAGIEQLGPTLAALETEADALWAPRKSAKREYYQAQDAFDQAGAALKAATARSKDWKEQAEAVREAERSLAEVQARQREVRQRRAQLERIRRVLPVLRALDAAQARLDAFGDTPLLPEDAGTVLSQGLTASALAEAEQQRQALALAAAQSSLATLRIEPGLLALAADIRALGEERLQCRGHADEIARMSGEAEALGLSVRALAAQLGWDAADEQALRARLPAAPLLAELDALLRQQDGRQQQHEAARRSREAKQAERAQANATLAALPPASGRPALQAALERARKLGDHAGTLDDLHAQQARLDAELQAALQRLGRWTQAPESLRAMLVPDNALIQRLLDDERRDAASLEAAQTQAQARQDELAQAESELAQLIATWQPVSREQVIEARQQRDAHWLLLRADARRLGEEAPAYEQAVQQADALADQRFDRIQHETERQARTRRIETLALAVAQERQRVDALRARIDSSGQQWQDLALHAGLPALPLALAPEWLAARQRALDAADAVADIERQQQALRRQGEEARRALQAELGGDVECASLESAVKHAEAALALASRTQGERATLAAQIADADKALLELVQAEEAAQAQWQSWQAQWTVASAAAGCTPQRSDLALMAAITQKLDQIDQLRGPQQLGRMRAALERLAAQARTLAQRALLPAAEGGDADLLVQQLLARADAAQQAEAEAQRLRAAVETARAGLVAAQAELQAVAARLSLLVSLAGTDDREALARAAEASRERRELMREIEAGRQQLAAGGDGLDAAALRAEAAAVDPVELASQWDDIQQQEDQLLHEAQALGAAREKASTLLDAFDGSDKAAQADAARQDAIARMAQAAQGYVQARTAARLLRWAIERYRQTRQGPLLALASGIFATLTLGSFSRLVVDTDEKDQPRLLGLRADGRTTVGVEGMSEGSRDQLYLALRLAALQTAGAARPLPFVADDLFVNFDDERSAAGLRALAALSRTTQVLFLTHHRHLAGLAREVLGPALNIVEL